MSLQFREFKSLIKEIPVGKQLPDAVYIHESAIDTLPKALGRHIAKAIISLSLEDEIWNVIKFSKRDHKITLLHYPAFFEDAYPALDSSYTIDLEKSSCRKTTYRNSENPPILHRKETFLKPSHPQVSVFREITEEGERAGLYENPKTIGFKKNWGRLISRKGYILNKNGRLIPKCNQELKETTAPVQDKTIDRHLTAIDRNKLSAPMQLLARHDYFNGEFSVLDYGCGKGDDIRELEMHGIDVSGWDPVHRKDGNRTDADIVNLGYVINVIEDRAERDQALKDAYTYTQKLLCVSVMLGSEAIASHFTPYKDGVITQRNTFQKYFSQSEFRSYLETTLDEIVVAAGPGIFLVFKDKDEEQLFLSSRQRVKRKWQHLTQKEKSTKRSVSSEKLVEKHKFLFDNFWKVCLELGRIPANDEFELSVDLRRVAGSHKKAFDALINLYEDNDFQQSKRNRRDDLLVYLALGLFEKRKPYTHMPESLKRDLKVHFSTYNDALVHATKLLFSVGDEENIEQACKKSYGALNCGLLAEGHSFTFHASLISRLPPVLRVYLGCGEQIYGEYQNIDLIKIHTQSGKISLMRYKNFENSLLPKLTLRIKIKLHQRDIDFFDYTEGYEPQLLYLKSRYLPASHPRYSLQAKFDRKLESLNLFDFSGFGPDSGSFFNTLARKNISLARL
ncbi:MAG: DNA phosphorothioation-associated putative methyltransferase [Gammaproteobacteria bacterium]|nr:DNA phosphorothioation-associated putative methyltransferase [Gammaproteobacteria bacterium]